MSDVFLSYAREDIATAEKLAALLEANGMTVWWDRRLVAGDDIDRVIEHALDAAIAVVVLWSPHSVESRWVRAEANAAAEAGKLVPVRIADCKLPLSFRGIQTPDVFASREQVARLGDLLTQKLRPGEPPARRIELSPQSTATFLDGMKEILDKPSTSLIDQFKRELEFSRRHPWTFWGGGLAVYFLSVLAAMEGWQLSFDEANAAAFVLWMIVYFAYRRYRLARAT